MRSKNEKTISARVGFDIDAHIGQIARRRRTMLGLSQSDVAAALSVTFQQVQKYESGASRISAGRLYDLAKTLKVPVDYFFSGLPGQSDTQDAETLRTVPVEDRQALQLVRLFHAIPTARHRQQFLELARALGRQAE